MRRVLLAAFGLLALITSRGSAQTQICDLAYSGNVTREGPRVLIAGPLLFRCTDGTELRADRAEGSETSREVHLYGNVDYRDPTRRLTSQYATYSSATGRLYATGNVVFTDATRGSTLTGPELEYYRAQPGRPQPQVIATGRPHLRLAPSNARPTTNQEPFEIDADRLTTIGEDQLSASGRVVIRRSDLDAAGSEAQYDGVRERLDLRGNARIKGERFDLAGETIEATLPGGSVDRVVARQQASLASDRIQVAGPEIQLFFANELLQRLVTRGTATGSRPVVTATGFRLEADSVEALLPGQRLDSVVAIGSARGEAYDTTQAAPPAGQIGATDRDWVIGDTIVGVFAQADSLPARAGAAPDTTPQLRRIMAKGDASSLYRVRSEEKTSGGRPGLNYLAGSVIRLFFENGEMELAQVTGLERGVYLDPTVPTTGGPPPQQRPRT